MNRRMYRAIVRPALLHGTECWLIKKTQLQRVMVAEMGMIRWMCGHTILDRIRNVMIRDNIGMAPIKDKISEARLTWFDHVRRSIDATTRRCKRIIPSGCRKGRGRPMKSQIEVIR